MKLEIASRPPSLRPFSNIFSLGPQTSSAIRKLAGSRHLPFSSCSHRRNNYAARSGLGASVLPENIFLCPSYTRTRTRLRLSRGRTDPPLPRFTYLSRMEKLISYDGTNKNSDLRVDYPSERRRTSKQLSFCFPPDSSARGKVFESCSDFSITRNCLICQAGHRDFGLFTTRN